MTQALSALQDAENALATAQDRQPAEVIAPSLEPNEYGGFDPSTNTIEINSYRLEYDDVGETVNSLAHEGRHAYQQWAIDHPGFHRNVDEVDAWRTNLEPGPADDPYPNYITFDDDEIEYRNQPVEADAWSFGDTVSDRMYGGRR